MLSAAERGKWIATVVLVGRCLVDVRLFCCVAWGRPALMKTGVDGEARDGASVFSGKRVAGESRGRMVSGKKSRKLKRVVVVFLSKGKGGGGCSGLFF